MTDTRINIWAGQGRISLNDYSEFKTPMIFGVFCFEKWKAKLDSDSLKIIRKTEVI
jgi:hypothetical protein